MGYHQNRYSPLRQINKSNVKRLVPVWNSRLEQRVRRAGAAARLRRRHVRDQRQVRRSRSTSVTGKQIWQHAGRLRSPTRRASCAAASPTRASAIYERQGVPHHARRARRRARRRRPARRSGSTKVAEWKEGYSMTVAPLIANGVLITGMLRRGVRRRAASSTAGIPQTGKKLWRRYTTAGPRRERPRDLGAARRRICAAARATWITGSYDPELDLVYWGTGNAGAVEPRESQGRQPLRGVDPRDQAEDRRDRLALPVRAERRLGLGCDWEIILADIPRERPDAQGRDADEPQRLPLRARPHQREAPLGAAVRQGQLGDARRHGDRPAGRDRKSRRSCAPARQIEMWPSMRGAKNWPHAAFNPNTGLLYANTIPRLLDLPVHAPDQRVQAGPALPGRREHQLAGQARDRSPGTWRRSIR